MGSSQSKHVLPNTSKRTDDTDEDIPLGPPQLFCSTNMPAVTDEIMCLLMEKTEILLVKTIDDLRKGRKICIVADDKFRETEIKEMMKMLYKAEISKGNVCIMLCKKPDEIEERIYYELYNIADKIIKVDVNPDDPSIFATSESRETLKYLVSFMIEEPIRIKGTRYIQVYPSPVSRSTNALVKDSMTALAKQFPRFNFIYTTYGELRRDIPLFIVCELCRLRPIIRHFCRQDYDLPDYIIHNCWLFILHKQGTHVCIDDILSRLESNRCSLERNRVVTLNYNKHGVFDINLDLINVIPERIANLSLNKETAFVYNSNHQTDGLLYRLEIALKHEIKVFGSVRDEDAEDNNFIVPCFDTWRDDYNFHEALRGIPERFYRQICIVYFHHTEPHVLKEKTFRSMDKHYGVAEVVDCVYKYDNGNCILYDCSLNEMATKKIYNFLTNSKDWLHMGPKQSKQTEDKAVVSPDVVDGDEVLVPPKPWRNVNAKNLPREEFLQFLKDDIKKFDTLKRINILNIGYVGAGKSSFINTINSCLDVKDYVAHRAIPGDDPESQTTELEHYVFDGFPHISLWDTRGIDNHFGLSSKDFECLLNGNIKQGYIFNKSKPISDRNLRYILHPSLDDRPHVVCFVFDGNTLQRLLKEERHAITLKECLEHIAKSKGLRYLILLTKMDQVCPIVKTDSLNVYTSETVESLVMGMAACLNIQPINIVPIVNYNSNDPETNISTNIVALIALRQLLRNANDFIANAKQGQ